MDAGEGTQHQRPNTNQLTLLFEHHQHGDEPIYLRRDSEFTVGSAYEDGSANNLGVGRGALLLVADCVGKLKIICSAT